VVPRSELGLHVRRSVTADELRELGCLLWVFAKNTTTVAALFVLLFFFMVIYNHLSLIIGYLRSVRPSRLLCIAPLIDLERIYASTRAVDQGTETEADLNFLQGKATSLGGLRPKCTVLDADGTLALGKLPSIADLRSIVRGEVLALKLAKLARLDAAEARIETLEGTAVAVIRRFDRTADAARIPYLSGGSLLQARRDEDRTYTELADALRRVSASPAKDVRELWRRMLFNLLITNVDDHLWNVGVLYAGNGQWRLAPAFDVNPFPDRVRESKTWLSEDTGPITSLKQLIAGGAYFGLQRAEAEEEATAMATALAGWREVATSKDVGLAEAEIEAFEPAFEHAEARAMRGGSPR
jgi:serine/threonine-protein kinase HipA